VLAEESALGAQKSLLSRTSRPARLRDSLAGTPRRGARSAPRANATWLLPFYPLLRGLFKGGLRHHQSRHRRLGAKAGSFHQLFEALFIVQRVIERSEFDLLPDLWLIEVLCEFVQSSFLLPELGVVARGVPP
jgi:hypothetical protein